MIPRRLAVLAATLAVTGYVNGAPAVWGQTRPEEGLGGMTDAQLSDEGWTFEEQGSSPGSVVGGILAMTVGTAAHGLGHIYAGDTRTGRILAISEGVSLVMIGLSFLAEGLSHSDGSLAPLYEPLLPLGGSLFATTWLLDVIGTFKGTAVTFSEQSRPSFELAMSAGYTHSAIQGMATFNSAQGEVRLDIWPFYLYPRGSYAVDESVSNYGASTGLRFGVGRRARSFVFFELEAMRHLFDDLGFNYWSLAAMVGLSFDVGEVFPHLDGLVFRNTLGAGTQRHRFSFNPDGPVTATNFLVLETALAATPTAGLLVEVGYQERPDEVIGGVSQGIGAFFAMLSYAVSDRSDLYLSGAVGHGLQMTAGTVVYLVR